MVNLVTIEDVQKFIDLHSDIYPNINSLKSRKYWKSEEVDGVKTSELWKLIQENNFQDKIKWTKEKSDLSHLNSAEDFQSIIDDNSIQSAKEFCNKFSGIYSRAQDLGVLGNLSYPNNPDRSARKLFLNSFKTIDDYDKYIKSNGLIKPSEFKEKDERLYRKFIEAGYGRIYKWRNCFDNWEFPKDAQDLIDQFGWESPSEMYKDEYGKYVYEATNRRGLCSSLVFKNRQIKYSQEEAINLISNRCSDRGYIFKNKSSFVYKGALETNIEICCPVHNHTWITSFNSFVKSDHGCRVCGMTRSLLEEEVERYLKNTGILFEPEKFFDWLIYLNNMSLDFYIPNLNLAIECQGEQHFQAIGWYSERSFNQQVIRDNKKFELCKSHGIEILYYCNPEILKKNKSHNVDKIISLFDTYISKVYQSPDELIKEILSRTP